MKAVILAGGEGTRLRPLTLTVPKALVPVVNQPFLEHVLTYLRRHGVDQAVLTVSYLADRLKEHFGAGGNHGLSLVYSVEEQPRGTAGAVRAVAGLLDGAFLVLNGDLFTDIDLTGLVAFHRQKGAAATIALIRVDDPTTFGMVETDGQGRVLRFVEKPRREQVTTHYVNGGIYVLEPEALALVPESMHYMFESGLFPRLLAEGWPVYGYATEPFWHDIGTPERYLQLHAELLGGRCPSIWPGAPSDPTRGCYADPTAVVEGQVLLGLGAVLGPESRVLGPAVLGAGCRLERGAVVDGGVLWSGVSVGAGAHLERCLVGSGCRLGPGVVAEAAVIGNNVAVPEGGRLARGAKLPVVAQT
ncbi:MAG: NDP-sugar synthase [Chloroflexi bacterium]|nr:NDP-sugar synthase [Chloroflexota bacterium]